MAYPIAGIIDLSGSRRIHWCGSDCRDLFSARSVKVAPNKPSAPFEELLICEERFT